MHKKYIRKKKDFRGKGLNLEEQNNLNTDIESLSLSSENDEEDSSEEENSDEQSNIKTIFFPRPFLTFFLSKSSQKKFINTVKRSNASTKLNSLIVIM